MSDEDVKLVRNLDRVLFDETASAAEVREQLESEGVDVAALVTRVRDSAAEAYRAAVRKEADTEEKRRQGKRGQIFGNLAGYSKDKLLELLDQAARGAFGEPALARCRNQKPQNMSESDLRTLLEDIESTIEE